METLLAREKRGVANVANLSLVTEAARCNGRRLAGRCGCVPASRAQGGFRGVHPRFKSPFGNGGNLSFERQWLPIMSVTFTVGKCR